MGMLLRFSPKANRTCPPPLGMGQTAQVILFTGVRYERTAEDKQQKPLRKIRRARKG